MSFSAKPYSEYKESGLPWLGRMPRHWDLIRGKYLLEYRKELNNDKAEGNVLSLTLRGVVRNDPDDPEGLVPKDYGTYQIFEKNDLVFKLIDLENLQTSRVGLVPERGIMSPAYVRLIPRDKDLVSFYYHQYFDLYLRGVFNQIGAGVRATLGPADLLALPLPVPPDSERDQVVRFLDALNASIKAYLKAKRLQIELLNEQARAISDQAVTKGLRSNIGFKPSGIDWIGDIPSDWHVMKLHWLIHLQTGFPFPSSDFSSDPKDIRLLRGINVTPIGVRWESVVRWPAEKLEEVSSFALEVGDIVLGMDRPIVRSGVRVALVSKTDVPSLLLQRVARIRAGTDIDQNFLYLVLRGRAFTNHLTPLFTGISVPHISPDQIMSFRLALPDLAEQKAIVRWVEEQTAPVKQQIDNIEKEIALTREYRTRLVADVVTGKLDVRRVEIPEIETEGGAEAPDLEPSGEMGMSEEEETVAAQEEADAAS